MRKEVGLAIESESDNEEEEDDNERRERILDTVKRTQ